VLALGLWLSVRDRQRTPAANESLLHGLRLAASNPQTWILSGIGLSLTGPVLAFAGLWGAPWFKTVHGIERTEAAQLLSLVFLGWLVAGPTVGWLSDRLRRRRAVLLAGTALSTTTMAAILLYSSAHPVWLGTLLLLNGVGGACMIIAFAAGREHNQTAAGGAALGIINTCVVGSGALYQPLIGWLLDLGWEGGFEAGVRIYPAHVFQGALLVLPGGGLLGFALALVMREPRNR
ncbi:MAG: MFS transporter, partial [Gammaproteobacteria bacterium]